MNNEQRFPPITESEIELETQGFVRYKREQEALKEKDQLIIDMASRLGLLDNYRGSYFMDEAANKGIRIPKPGYSENFGVRLQLLADGLANSSDPSVELLAEIICMVQTLSSENRLDELQKCIKAGFPEYYYEP